MPPRLMARAAAYLHPPAIARTLSPKLYSPIQSNIFYSLVPRFKSASLFNLSSHRRKNWVAPVCAQSRRKVTSLAEEAVASATDLHYEGPLKIVMYPDPILRAKNKRVNLFDGALKKIADEMFDLMYRTDGIGLSAPQVGINIQLMVFNAAGERGVGEEIVLVNPRINRYSKKIIPYEEGCLSFPGILAFVNRPDSLQVDAQDITGSRFQINLTGLPARVFQHEYDHLLGILYFDRMSDEVLDSIRTNLQDMERTYEEKTGLPSPEKIDTRQLRKKGVGFGKR